MGMFRLLVRIGFSPAEPGGYIRDHPAFRHEMIQEVEPITIGKDILPTIIVGTGGKFCRHIIEQGFHPEITCKIVAGAQTVNRAGFQVIALAEDIGPYDRGYSEGSRSYIGINTRGKGQWDNNDNQQ
jgi:hypothetical protein